MSGQFSGDALKAAREKAGLSREQFAIEVARTAGTIADWENGHATPRAGTVFAIARALGVRPADLMVPDGDS